MQKNINDENANIICIKLFSYLNNNNKKLIFSKIPNLSLHINIGMHWCNAEIVFRLFKDRCLMYNKNATKK